MAVTIAVLSETSRGRNVAGRDREVYADITGDSSYPTGGEDLTLAMLQALCPGLGKVVADWSKVKFFNSEADPSNRRWVLDRTNKKLLAYAAGVEVVNTTDLSAVTIRVKVSYNA